MKNQVAHEQQYFVVDISIIAVDTPIVNSPSYGRLWYYENWNHNKKKHKNIRN